MTRTRPGYPYMLDRESLRMAQETGTSTERRFQIAALSPWQAGIVGGLFGGIAFGLMMTMDMRMVMETAIPGMYGLPESLGLGWIIHLIHAAIFGVIFGLVVSADALRDVLDSALSLTVAGLVYGLVVWVVAASIVMPLWVNLMMGMGEPVPNFMIESGMGHAVFGVVLGFAYAVLRT